MNIEHDTFFDTIRNQAVIPQGDQGWKPLRYHQMQNAAWCSNSRFVGLAAGRGSGKTELARRRIVRMLPIHKPWGRPMYFYALPTYKQARRVAWQAILDLIPSQWIADKPNKSEMRIDTVFGSQLYVVGLDEPRRIEGSQWDGCVIDESCDQKPGVFTLSVMPALTHKNGWCWRIGVPKRTGHGAAEFKRWCGASPAGEGPVAQEHYTWPSRDILTEEQLAYAKEHYSSVDFAEQYEASWEKVGGLIFYEFNEVRHISDQVTYREDLPIIVGSDFNVDPMAWVLMQERRDVPGSKRSMLFAFDEIYMRNTNTKATLDELYRRYSNHKAGWDFHGDATGRSRNTRASESDYQQIKGDRRFINAKVWYPTKNPRRHDRFAACNAMFKNAAGDERVRIHPRCRALVRDLTTRAYIEGTSEPDDHDDVGHITDGFGYPVHRMYPVRAPSEIIGGQVYAIRT